MAKFYPVLLDDVLADAGHLMVKAPRKYDDAYICKASFNGQKTFISFSAPLLLVSCRQPNKGVVYVYFKLPSTVRKQISELETHLVDVCKANVDLWFESRHKLNADVIEEYFHSNIVMDKKHGMVFKTRIYTPDTDVPYLDLPLNTKYHATFRLVGVRFQKQSVSLVWDIPFMELAEDQSHIDSNASSETESEVVDMSGVVDPLDESIQEFRKDLQFVLDEKQKALDLIVHVVAELKELLCKELTTMEEVEQAKARLKEFM